MWSLMIALGPPLHFHHHIFVQSHHSAITLWFPLFCTLIFSSQCFWVPLQPPTCLTIYLLTSTPPAPNWALSSSGYGPMDHQLLCLNSLAPVIHEFSTTHSTFGSFTSFDSEPWPPRLRQFAQVSEAVSVAVMTIPPFFPVILRTSSVN